MTYAADDYSHIRKRQEELAREREAAYQQPAEPELVCDPPVLYPLGVNAGSSLGMWGWVA
jgi:hypothetical protein